MIKMMMIYVAYVCLNWLKKEKILRFFHVRTIFTLLVSTGGSILAGKHVRFAGLLLKKKGKKKIWVRRWLFGILLFMLLDFLVFSKYLFLSTGIVSYSIFSRVFSYVCFLEITPQLMSGCSITPWPPGSQNIRINGNLLQVVGGVLVFYLQTDIIFLGN